MNRRTEDTRRAAEPKRRPVPIAETQVSEPEAAYICWLLSRRLCEAYEADEVRIGALSADRVAAMATWLHDILPPARQRPLPRPRRYRRPPIRPRRTRDRKPPKSRPPHRQP